MQPQARADRAASGKAHLPVAAAKAIPQRRQGRHELINSAQQGAYQEVAAWLQVLHPPKRPSTGRW